MDDPKDEIDVKHEEIVKKLKAIGYEEEDNHERKREEGDSNID